MKQHIVYSLTLFILLQSQSAWTAEYSRKAEFGAVRFTVEQIAKFSNDLFSYIKSVNNPSNATTGTVQFESDRYSASFDLPLLAKDFDKVPDYSHSFKFRAHSSDNNLSLVIISLGDSYRYADVSGLNHSHVTGFLSIVRDKIEDFEVGFGGSKFRVFLAAGYLIALSIISGLVVSRYDDPRVWMTAWIGVLVLLFGVVFLLPWERIFPGTLITYDSLSFLQRNAHIFTFLAFLLAIFTIVWPLVLRGRKRPKQAGESGGGSASA